MRRALLIPMLLGAALLSEFAAAQEEVRELYVEGEAQAQWMVFVGPFGAILERAEGEVVGDVVRLSGRCPREGKCELAAPLVLLHGGRVLSGPLRPLGEQRPDKAPEAVLKLNRERVRLRRKMETLQRQLERAMKGRLPEDEAEQLLQQIVREADRG